MYQDTKISLRSDQRYHIHQGCRLCSDKSVFHSGINIMVDWVFKTNNLSTYQDSVVHSILFSENVCFTLI